MHVKAQTLQSGDKAKFVTRVHLNSAAYPPIIKPLCHLRNPMSLLCFPSYCVLRSTLKRKLFSLRSQSPVICPRCIKWPVIDNALDFWQISDWSCLQGGAGRPVNSQPSITTPTQSPQCLLCSKNMRFSGQCAESLISMWMTYSSCNKPGWRVEVFGSYWELAWLQTTSITALWLNILIISASVSVLRTCALCSRRLALKWWTDWRSKFPGYKTYCLHSSEELPVL